MNMKYRVIKPFGPAKVGDELVIDKYGLATMDITEQRDGLFSQRAVSMDKQVAQGLVDDGYLAKVATLPTKADGIVDSTVTYIDELLKQYADDNAEINRKADEGDVPPCVRVEANTVHYNLKKVLNIIRAKLTNDEQTSKNG